MRKQQRGHLFGDAAVCGLPGSPQGKAEERAAKVAPGVAAKRLIGRKLVWMGVRSTRSHKVDALAWVLRRDVWQVGAMRVEDDQLAP